MNAHKSDAVRAALDKCKNPEPLVNLLPPREQRSIKQRIGRAVAQYRRDRHDDAAYGIFFDSHGRVCVRTSAANGDNVWWATELHYCATSPLYDLGYRPDGQRRHCCGDVSSEWKKP